MHTKSILSYNSVVGGYQCNSFVTLGVYVGLPGFPSLVSTSTPQDCHWTLVAPHEDSVFQVRINYFDLPVSTGCSSHSLTVYDGLSDSSPQLAKLCGNICGKQLIPLSKRFAYIKLHIDSIGAFRGFQAVIEEAL